MASGASGSPHFLATTILFGKRPLGDCLSDTIHDANFIRNARIGWHGLRIIRVLAEIVSDNAFREALQPRRVGPSREHEIWCALVNKLNEVPHRGQIEQ